MIVVANVGFKHYEDENDEPSIFNEVRSRRYNITNVGELMTVMNQMSSDIKLTIENAQLEKSGLHIHSINKLTVMYTIYDPTRAGTYIKLPKFINDKKACINIKNLDDKCLKYCVQCHTHQIYNKDHPDRFYHYKKLNDDLNWSDITFPCSNADIDKLEDNNKKQISINVYRLNQNNKIELERRAHITKAKYHINL